MSEIQLLKNNDKKEWSDVEWVTEFHEFLQGNIPKGITLGKESKLPKMTSRQSSAIIWYLQEHFSIIPDQIEVCDNCGTVFDSWGEGTYIEDGYKKMHNFCGGCVYLIPEKYFKD